MPELDPNQVVDAHPTVWQRGMDAAHTVEGGYEGYVAQPLTRMLTDKVGIPKWVAQAAIPQTMTGAALDAASLALPELKAGKVLGEAAGPVARFVGSRLGRTATMGAIGAGAETVSGGSPISGALQGVAGEAGAQFTRGAAAQVLRRTGKAGMLRDTLRGFGKSLTDAMPWLGKLENSKDFADTFINGGAYQRGLSILRREKGAIGGQARGLHINVPSLEDPTKIAPVPFEQADELLTQMQRRSHLPVGDPRSGAGAADWNAVAHETREAIVKQLDSIKSGLGKQYLQARSKLDAAIVLGGHPTLLRGGVFRHDDVFNADGAINQPLMLQRLNKYSNQLQRSIGKDNVEAIKTALRRGATGEVADVPTKGERTAMRAGVSPMAAPHVTIHPPSTYKAVGKVPKYFEPPQTPFEMGTQNIVSGVRQQNKPATTGPNDMTGTDRSSALGNEANRMHAQKIAGVNNPERVARVEDLNRQVTKGKTPDVHAGLRSGRLSMPAVRRLLTKQTEKTAPAMLAHLGPADVQHMLALASPEERAWLEPLARQRLGPQAEG